MKFQTKIVLGVTLIQAVLLSVLVLSVLTRMDEACRQQLELRAGVTSQLLAAAARDSMVAYDIATLQSLADGLVASNQVAYLDFLDADGKTMVSTRTAPPPLDPANTQGDADGEVMTRSLTIHVAGQPYGSVHFGIQLDEMAALLAAVRHETVGIALGVMAAVAVFSLLLGKLLHRSLKPPKTGTVNGYFNGSTSHLALVRLALDAHP